ncbi:MAG: hypothetical protein LQ352_004802 [Teloschistes flavicans]|nr:MAG: hypothetical protein LQ352_004802 [Teloschistes flavicans]
MRSTTLIGVRQISSDASKVLYDREFVIEVNCVHLKTGSRFRRKANHFPFQKARQVTLRIGIPERSHGSEIEHVFDHLTHLYGLFFSTPNTVKKLGLQFHELPELFFADCESFQGVPKSGAADTIGFSSYYMERIEEGIAALLPPLAICGQVSELPIHLPGEQSQSVGLQKLCDHYRKMTTAVSAGRVGGNVEYKVMEERYLKLLSADLMKEAQMERAEQIQYKRRLKIMCKNHSCTHTGPAEECAGRGNQDSKCKGCRKWVSWLLECSDCKFKACAGCIQQLRITRRKINSRKARNKSKGEAHHGLKHKGKTVDDATAA